MMVRTIQHPGVQIQESEIGSYSSTVVMNNAYIMGFADRGPIYDYSWITTTREFTKIYGEPQTEAEKYLFIAVQSVLQNGGTPIVARMPYDNKQCKAYKALKITWADSTPANDADLASPLVDLAKISKKVDDEYTNRPLANIFTTDSVTVNGQPITSGDLKKLTIAQITMQLNPYETGSENSDGVLYDGIVSGFRLNGVYPSGLGVDQAAVTSLVDSFYSDASPKNKKYYKYDEGLNKANYPSGWSMVEDGFLMNTTVPSTFYPVKEIYIKFEFNMKDELGNYILDEETKNYIPTTGLISIFNTAPEDGEISGFTALNANYIPAMYKEDIEAALADVKADGLVTLAPVDSSYKVYALSIKKGYIYAKRVNPSDPNSRTEDHGNGNMIDGAIYALNEKNHIFVGDTIACMQFVNESDTTPFIITPKIQPTGEKTYYRIYKSTVPNDISQYVDFAKNSNSNVVASAAFLNVFGDDEMDGQKFGQASNSTPVSSVQDLDTIYPLFRETTNGMAVINGSITTTKISPAVAHANNMTLVGFYNSDIESPAVSGTITSGQVSALLMESPDVKAAFDAKILRENFVAGILERGGQAEYNVWSYLEFKDPVLYPESLTVKEGDVKKYDVVDPRITSGPARWNKLNYTDFVCSGSVYINDFAMYVAFDDTLADIPVTEVTDDMILENESLVWIKTIYNNPYFLRLDEPTYSELEASLLNTPEMGFKYAIYMDAEECEISNDQYDDLVTVNQFKAVNRSIDKYGQDIDDANFIIVDKQKTVVNGVGGNIGFFTTIIDPFDALKVQRLLVNPKEKDASGKTVNGVNKDNEPTTRTFKFDHSLANINRMDYWAYESADAWNKIYDDLLDSMDCLQRVRNADGVYIGEPNPIDSDGKASKPNILDSWSIPLTGGFYDESISKMLMKKFPGIPLANISADDLTNPDYKPSIIDHNYATHVTVAVCKTTIDQTNGKIVVSLVETFFGSLFNEKNLQNGRSLFIGDIINENSDYIEFYRNNYVAAGNGDYDPPEYHRTTVNQIFIKDSEELKNAAQMCGIDAEEYGCDALDKEVREQAEKDYYEDLEKHHIYAIDKKEVCLYNLHWESALTSFSKKESQKIIANTTGMYSVADGTTINVAANFLIDMDRCISFIKNIDAIPLHFICDAGLSTIAQFCDNVVWNPNKRSIVGEKVDPVTKKKTGVKIYEKTGGWITQPFDPDNDPDGEDRYITGYEDIATWRKVVEKIGSIAGEIRKDCFAIIDAPRQLTLDGAAPKIRRTKFTNNFDKTIGKCLRYISGINSSYIAGYYNWLRTTDQYTGKSIWIPPTSKIIGNYCYLNIINLPWLAPAGLTYGIINGCHAISHNPDGQEEDQIYLKSWNYLKQYPLDGIVVEGQKTLLGKESAFERVNVRLLFLDLERFAYNVSRTFKYQVNNAYTREQFVQTLKPKFEDYAIRGGIYEYLIKVDDQNNTPETIDANELRGDIFIKPARLIEYVLLNFTATTTATDFSELPLG